MSGKWHWLRMLVTLGCLGTAVRADFRVVGSDLLGLEFSRAFYEYSGRNGIKLALAFDGSRSGLEELKSGRADLALVVLPREEEAKLAGFQTVPLGYHALVVLVPAACPLESLTLEQMARIFGAQASGGGGGPMRWSELGLEGAWGKAFVTALAPEVGTGITLEYFRSAVLRGRELKPTVQRYATTADLQARLAGESHAIALAASAPAGAASLRTLRIAVSGTAPAVAPTAAALHEGRYALRLPVHVVFRPERAPALARLMEFLFGDTAAGVLAQADITPLPAAERAAQRQAAGAGKTTPR